MAGSSVSNQDLMDAINAIREGFATKDDLISMERRLETKFATKDDLKVEIRRLERKIDSYSQANVQHHLMTREEVGHLNKKFGNIQEGLKQAAGLG